MLRAVSKQEYLDFIKDYPRPLQMDCCAIGEPALITANDFTLGNWPESVVAKRFDDPATKYYILEQTDEHR